MDWQDLRRIERIFSSGDHYSSGAHDKTAESLLLKLISPYSLPPFTDEALPT
jgi:hypothetical protein